MSNRSRFNIFWSRLPSIRIATLLAGGIAAGVHLPIAFYRLFSLFLATGMLWCFLEWIPIKKTRILQKREWIPRLKQTTATFHQKRSCLHLQRRPAFQPATICYLLLVFLFGMIRYEYARQNVLLERETAARMELHAWDSLDMRGSVHAMHRSSSGRWMLDLQVVSTKVEGEVWRKPYKIRLYVNDERDVTDLWEGERVTATVRLFELDSCRGGYPSLLEKQNIFLHGELVRLNQESSDEGPGMAAKIRETVMQRIDLLFDEQTSGTARAILIGDRSKIDALQRERISRSGLSHIMAVSGLHVGFLAAPFLALVPFLWQWRHGWWIGLTGLLFYLFSYACVADFSPSVSRASLMIWIFAVGLLLQRIKPGANSLGLSASLLLTLHPGWLFDVGFQLSFAAVLIILITMPVMNQLIPAKSSRTLPGKVVRLLLMSGIIQTGLFPLLAFYFQEVSLSGPFTNLLVIPLLSVLVPGSFVLIGLSMAAPDLAVILNLPNVYIIKWIKEVADMAGRWSPGWVEVPLENSFLFLPWLGVIAGMAVYHQPRARWRLLILVLILIAGYKTGEVRKQWRPKLLTMTVVDVGQGDAIHIQTPGGKQLLVDTGDGRSGNLLSHLKTMEVSKLDRVVLTHPHADHIGGLPQILEELDVGAVIHSGDLYTSEIYQRNRKLIQQKKVPLKEVGMGDQIHLDDSIRLYVLGPEYIPGKNVIGGYGVNNRSVILKLVYGDTHFLLTGDAEIPQERELVRRYRDFLSSHLLKAGHHGSRTSTGRLFLSQVDPEYVTVSLSLRNRFGHPHEESVQRLNGQTEHLYYTSRVGSVRVHSDGRKIDVQGECEDLLESQIRGSI